MFPSLYLHNLTFYSTPYCTSIQVQVPSNTYNTVLENLDSDTEYTATVVPVYSAGEGQPMSENGKTCKFCMCAIICHEVQLGSMKTRQGLQKHNKNRTLKNDKVWKS